MRRNLWPAVIALLFPLAVAISQTSQIDSDLKFGIELYKNKMFDLAEEQFTKFLQQYPASPSAGPARYYLAKSEYEQGKFSVAAGNFQTFAAQFPDDPQASSAWLDAGESYSRANDFANAGLSYERLSVFYPKDPGAPRALIKAAKCFELASDTSRAEVSLLTVVQDYTSTPEYWDATLHLGNMYFASGQLVKAGNQYRALLSSDNDSVRVSGLLALGRLSLIDRSVQRAEKYFDDAIKLGISPQSDDALLESIQIDLDAGNFARALDRTQVMKGSSLTSQQNDRLGYETEYARIALGDQESLKKSLPKLKNLPWQYKIEIASLLDRKGNFPEGISLMRGLPPKIASERALDLYAELAYRTSRLKLADSLLSSSLEISKDPDPKEIVKLLDIESRLLNDGKRAVSTFTKYGEYLKDRPDAVLFYQSLEDEATENHAEAIAGLDNLVAEYPESDLAQRADSLSRVIRNSSAIDYRGAVVSLADVILQQGLSPANRYSSLMELGSLYENELKEFAKAERVYQEVAAFSTGDTQRVARYFLANAIQKEQTGKVTESSQSYSIYRELASAADSDSIAEKSLWSIINIQLTSGDTVSAEQSALSFLKTFPASPETPRVYSVLAEALYNSGAYHEAIAEAALAGALPKAEIILAESEIAIDSLDAAKTSLEQFFSTAPPKTYLTESRLVYVDLLKKMNVDADRTYLDLLDDLVPSRYRITIAGEYADYLYSAGRYDSAFSIYSTIGSDECWYRAPSGTLYKMAYCRLKSGDLNSAAGLFKEVVATSTNTRQVADSYLQLGNVYDSLGDREMSASFFEKAGAADASALVTAAETYFKLGDFDDASQIYQRILDSSPDDSLSQLCSARQVEIEYKKGNVKSADASAAKFRKKFGKSAEEFTAQFMLDKAEYLIDQKKYDEADKLLDGISSDYTGTNAYPASLLDRARIMVEGNDLDKAKGMLTDLLAKFPSGSIALQSHLELGNILMAQEKYQDAANNFRVIYFDSLAAGGLMRDCMIDLENAYESLAQYDGALEVSRKFVAMFPDDKSVMDMHIKIGILYEELKYFDQALQTFQNLAKDAGRDYQAELHYYIGAIYDDKSDYANAILEFLKVPYLVTPSPVVDWAAQAYYMAGKCYEKLNKPNDAIAMYQKIVDKPGTDPNLKSGAEREINRVKALLK